MNRRLCLFISGQCCRVPTKLASIGLGSAACFVSFRARLPAFQHSALIICSRSFSNAPVSDFTILPPLYTWQHHIRRQHRAWCSQRIGRNEPGTWAEILPSPRL